MEKEKLNLSKLAAQAKDGKIEIVYREGAAERFLDPIKPLEEIGLNLYGNIGTVTEFLRKRNDLFTPKECNITVDEYSITFTGNECQKGNKRSTTVKSIIESTKEFNELIINNDDLFDSQELAKYLRRRKNLFISEEQFNLVWKALSSFEAEVKKRIEKADDRSGNAVSFIKQEVTHNMPKNFNLLFRPFKGSELISIKVEVEVDSNTLKCQLVSFDIDEKVEKARVDLIESELESEISVDVKVRDFCITVFQ